MTFYNKISTILGNSTDLADRIMRWFTKNFKIFFIKGQAMSDYSDKNGEICVNA